MLAIGTVVNAQVTSIQRYGVHLQCGEDEILVLAPDVSWDPDVSIKELIQVGQSVPVRIIRWSSNDRTFVGSIRAADSGFNPYSVISPGEIHEAEIINIADTVVHLRLPIGACAFAVLTGKHQIGDWVRIEIISTDSIRGRIESKLVSDRDQQSSCPLTPLS
jgi:hypothetical protein